MKLLLALLSGAGLVGCAEQSQPISTAGPNYPYAAHSTTAEVSFPTNTVYASWSTAALQKKRLDLYAMLPQTQSRNGVPEYITHGSQLPQQDEIKKIEAELNKRYKGGEKAAELKEWWPSTRRHIT
jgi:hypothetical protein